MNKNINISLYDYLDWNSSENIIINKNNELKDNILIQILEYPPILYFWRIKNYENIIFEIEKTSLDKYKSTEDYIMLYLKYIYNNDNKDTNKIRKYLLNIFKE